MYPLNNFQIHLNLDQPVVTGYPTDYSLLCGTPNTYNVAHCVGVSGISLSVPTCIMWEEPGLGQYMYVTILSIMIPLVVVLV